MKAIMIDLCNSELACLQNVKTNLGGLVCVCVCVYVCVCVCVYVCVCGKGEL